MYILLSALRALGEALVLRMACFSCVSAATEQLPAASCVRKRVVALSFR